VFPSWSREFDSPRSLIPLLSWKGLGKRLENEGAKTLYSEQNPENPGLCPSSEEETMRCKVHILDKLSGKVFAAELTAVDPDRFEVLPFPVREELGAPSFYGIAR
jgi:hypothetical protein